ncbi:MAG: M3 family oligoendopeptidase [Pseudobdellovibrio sp.]
MSLDLQNTSWNNDHIYKGFEDVKIRNDFDFIQKQIEIIQTDIKFFTELLQRNSVTDRTAALTKARINLRALTDAKLRAYNLTNYARTATTVNSQNFAAQDLLGKSSKVMADLNKAAKPVELFVQLSPEDFFNELMQNEMVSELKANFLHARKKNDFLLSTSEEILLEGHAVDGYHAWSRMYSDLASTIKTEVDGEKMGLSQASSLVFQNDREKRKSAHYAINKAWENYAVPAAAILNALTGWRIENYKARSIKKELHYLNETCHFQKISRATLDSMMQTTFEHRSVGQKALNLMAKTIGIEKLGPWDILAAYPQNSQAQTKTTLPEAMKIITQAFGEFNPDMASFAQMMYEKNWIDSADTPNRATGAYCSGFPKEREPRVFITFEGSMKDVITLAHELGHAYHNWVMRDIPFSEIFYPSTLAETASIFAETLVRQSILKNSKNTEEKKMILWQDLESAASFLINIPARYEFECGLFEARKVKPLNVPELKKLTSDAWQKWYGNTLTEYNDMFWASKLHFSLSSLSFYNYPYLFGYLFSLGLYAKKDQHGKDFKQHYINILRDTGRLTAEELIQKYLNDDITKPNFWANSIKIVEQSVTEYAKL